MRKVSEIEIRDERPVSENDDIYLFDYIESKHSIHLSFIQT